MSDAAYTKYCAEFEQSYAAALSGLNGNAAHRELFESLVPLWTFLGVATNETIAINPTKELLLSHLSYAGETAKFLEVSSDKRFERAFSRELNEAARALSFTSYFDELISDSICLLNAFAVFDYRGTVVAVRCMLEDLYRHLYYKDHREYFVRVHELGESEFSLDIAPKEFRKYLKSTSYLRVLDTFQWGLTVRGSVIKGGIHSLSDALYSASSAYTHGAAPKLLNQFASNLDRSFSALRSDEVKDLVKKFVVLANLYLIFSHREYFARFNEADKRTVLRAFGATERAAIRRKVGA